MASLAQNAFVNSVPLPRQANLDNDQVVPIPVNPSADADPNNIMPLSAAFDAVDPATQQQPVGPALDAVSGQEDEPFDAVAARLAQGTSLRITSKEQWAALSPHEKEVIRAAKASGGRLRASDALRIYQDSVKRSRASQVQTVALPDGRTVNMVNNQIIPEAKQAEAVKMEIKQAEDGTMVMIDPLTGRSFPAYYENSGEAVRGPAKLSATQEDNIKRLQLQSENVGARLTDLTRFTEAESVAYNDETGTYEPAGWLGGTKVASLRKQLESEKSDFDKRIEVAIRPVNRSSKSSPAPAATPAPTPATRSAAPSQTPRPNPMPTPEKFQVGKRYRDAAGNEKTYRGNGAWE
jgi:hypothetical protein